MENIHADSTYDNTGICSPDDLGVNIVDNDLYSDYSEQDPQGIPTESDDPLYAQVSQKSNRQYEGLDYDQSPTVDYIELPYGGTKSETTVEFNNVVNEKRLAKKMRVEDGNCTGKLKLILVGVAIGLVIVFVVVACAIILTPKDSEEAGVAVPASDHPSSDETTISIAEGPMDSPMSISVTQSLAAAVGQTTRPPPRPSTTTPKRTTTRFTTRYPPVLPTMARR